ncbi:sigma-70 family RNA polymerase sigma factor [Naumannella cuiyingiana]|uniref:RNA polymerase sigma-70 factor (ECF subfamily) n=1 Tax=Naumannella cuiyingiana TaxID=1347891 RepID=A0A7Z0D679_9ACTN|nr:RNA polymerase sigma-70 factor (ECF subfamily) [Naumannella cuiyingiana]
MSGPGADELGPEEFARLHTRLLGLAYRMLGGWADAEDVAAETWLRWHTSRPDDLVHPQAWLTTVATRLSLDRWRTLARRREDYVGPWLPEPIDPGRLPHETVEQRESLAFGLLHLMERLTSDERAVYVLRYAFDHSFAEIAEMLGRTPASCRQLAHRARARVAPDGVGGSRSAQRALLDRLVAAIADGRAGDAVAMITEDAVLISDGGGKVKSALRPILGPDKIVRFLVGISRAVPGATLTAIDVNAGAALLLRQGAERRLLRIDTRDGAISAVHLVGNPDKLDRLELPA